MGLLADSVELKDLFIGPFVGDPAFKVMREVGKDEMEGGGLSAVKEVEKSLKVE